MKLSAIVVEDKKIVREQIIDEIKRYCENVEIIGDFESAEDALPILIAVKPDVLFLDIGLPGMSGLDLLKALHKQKLNVIIISDRGTQKNLIRLMNEFSGSKRIYFIDKVLDAKKLKKALEIIEYEVNNSPISTVRENIEIPIIGGGERFIPVNEIIYFKTYRKRATAIRYRKNAGLEEIESRKNVTFFYNKLKSKGFTKIGRDCLINDSNLLARLPTSIDLDQLITNIYNGFDDIDKEHIKYHEIPLANPWVYLMNNGCVFANKKSKISQLIKNFLSNQ